MRNGFVLRRLSVRARTTITATGIVALATAGIGLLLIGYLHTRLSSELDSALQGELAEARQAVQRGAHVPPAREPIRIEVLPSEQDPRRGGPAPAPMPDDRPSAAAPAPSDERSARAAREERFQRERAERGEPAPAPTTTATATAPSPDGTRTLVASASTRSVDQATRAATTALLISAPLLLAIVAGLTWFSTGRALRPVKAIREEFTQLSAHDLRGRMPVPNSGDEVARLARTLNETLDRLDRSVHRQRQFVADASHELRSPLAALRTPLEVACAHPDRVDWPDVAAGTLEDLERLERLTSDLLALAHLDGTPRTEGSTLNLGDLIRETLRHRAPGRIEWDVDLADGVVIDGHRSHLARLLTNLVDNAERHAERRARISLRAEAGHAHLDVTDDGPGIPVESSEYVFERFARLDSARGRDEGGAGLGLALARDIAALHGGTLGIAESDRGAHFTARLPLAEPSGDAPSTVDRVGSEPIRRC